MSELGVLGDVWYNNEGVEMVARLQRLGYFKSERLDCLSAERINEMLLILPPLYQVEVTGYARVFDDRQVDLSKIETVKRLEHFRIYDSQLKKYVKSYVDIEKRMLAVPLEVEPEIVQGHEMSQEEIQALQNSSLEHNLSPGEKAYTDEEINELIDDTAKSYYRDSVVPGTGLPERTICQRMALPLNDYGRISIRDYYAMKKEFMSRGWHITGFSGKHILSEETKEIEVLKVPDSSGKIVEQVIDSPGDELELDPDSSMAGKFQAIFYKGGKKEKATEYTIHNVGEYLAAKTKFEREASDKGLKLRLDYCGDKIESLYRKAMKTSRFVIPESESLKMFDQSQPKRMIFYGISESDLKKSIEKWSWRENIEIDTKSEPEMVYGKAWCDYFRQEGSLIDRDVMKKEFNKWGLEVSDSKLDNFLTEKISVQDYQSFLQEHASREQNAILRRYRDIGAMAGMDRDAYLQLTRESAANRIEEYAKRAEIIECLLSFAEVGVGKAQKGEDYLRMSVEELQSRYQELESAGKQGLEVQRKREQLGFEGDERLPEFNKRNLVHGSLETYLQPRKDKDGNICFGYREGTQPVIGFDVNKLSEEQKVELELRKIEFYDRRACSYAEKLALKDIAGKLYPDEGDKQAFLNKLAYVTKKQAETMLTPHFHDAAGKSLVAQTCSYIKSGRIIMSGSQKLLSIADCLNVFSEFASKDQDKRAIVRDLVDGEHIKASGMETLIKKYDKLFEPYSKMPTKEREEKIAPIFRNYRREMQEQKSLLKEKVNTMSDGHLDDLILKYGNVPIGGYLRNQVIMYQELHIIGDLDPDVAKNLTVSKAKELIDKANEIEQSTRKMTSKQRMTVNKFIDMGVINLDPERAKNLSFKEASQAIQSGINNRPASYEQKAIFSEMVKRGFTAPLPVEKWKKLSFNEAGEEIGKLPSNDLNEIRAELEARRSANQSRIRQTVDSLGVSR